MYLNEKSWTAREEDPYKIDCKMRNFLDIYSTLKRQYPAKEVSVPDDEILYLRSDQYPLEKWLATADREYRRLYLSFWGKRITYHPEDEYEVSVDGESLKGGTEAYLNDSVMLSIGLDEKWEQESIDGVLTSLYEDEQHVSVINIYEKEQLKSHVIECILKREDSFQIQSYEELWLKRGELFPHLRFCPAVETNFRELEYFYLHQIVKKLKELERYCVDYAGMRFDVTLLTKTTPESQGTLTQYEKEHTFTDEKGTAYIASWHMRFTGIPGRIFFVPDYEEDSILICYVGKKLKNLSYPT